MPAMASLRAIPRASAEPVFRSASAYWAVDPASIDAGPVLSRPTTGRWRVVVASFAGARIGPMAAVPRANPVPTSRLPSNDASRAR